MTDHILNRTLVLKALKEELVGPSPQGEEIDCSLEVIIDDSAKAYLPWRQEEAGEEILRDNPSKRYGVGVLYPFGTDLSHSQVSEDSQETPAGSGDNAEENPNMKEESITNKAIDDLEEIGKRVGKEGELPDPDDFDLSSANAYKPSTMGVSFLVTFTNSSKLTVKVMGARYIKKKVLILGKERIWWLRKPFSSTAEFSKQDLCLTGKAAIQIQSLKEEGLENLKVNVEVFSRPYKGSEKRLITVCLVNRSIGGIDIASIFQAHLKVNIESSDPLAKIFPYPGPEHQDLDEEEASLALMYRDVETYAVGHGCAADWEQSLADKEIRSVSGECLPSYETPSITPDIRREDGSPIEVSMGKLAGLIKGDDGFTSLSEIIDRYDNWIKARSGEVGKLGATYRSAAERHLKECDRSLVRMKEGVAFLKSNPMARKAFELANYSMLLQQSRSKREVREIDFDPSKNNISFSENIEVPDLLNPESGRGNWRAFQIAFILMTLRSSVDPESVDRKTVELIWFPTGGGKTEAYLGLAAYSIFFRRLSNPLDTGVHALMRYTLRLLTAQQFQRASGLICAMEYIRRKNSKELGGKEFSIGIWLGGSTTPNTRQEALQALRKLNGKDRYAENMFVVTKCPYCRARMGPVKNRNKFPRNWPKTFGYTQEEKSVVFRCPDKGCEFSNGLPIYVTDEDIYEAQPTLVIGTVDKFAMLAWKPEARKLFGIGIDGERECSPPGLIIQDELHLISGPLGSMVGLYETLVEELCTDRRNQKVNAPKIVSSTATIRRYKEQIAALYARHDVALFPSPGLSAGDSFFSQYARQPQGDLAPGRVYVGVHAPGLGSMQTAQVRTFTSLLQAPVSLSPEERDPWWTLLIFFNSLRELGTTLSLFQSDIPDYLKVIRRRKGIELKEMRMIGLGHIKELTGRLPSDEVPKAIAELETTTYGRQQPVDVCLASNIVEVGVDIDRLSLMSVVGQPKSTSQYIQVTGRVGRRWWERPGLVVTIYGASKPRDRSHFEKFRSYHERLYAQVEPTSVTPFSPPTLERALPAVMAAYVRQLGSAQMAKSPYPCPSDLIEQLQKIILARVKAVEPEEEENFRRAFNKRSTQWKTWERLLWKAGSQDVDVPLLREAGAYATRIQEDLSWAVPTSMRNVDAECQVEITHLYLKEDEHA